VREESGHELEEIGFGDNDQLGKQDDTRDRRVRFAGSWLVDTLAESGCEVVSADNLLGGNEHHALGSRS